jgi:hypothetical protein
MRIIGEEWCPRGSPAAGNHPLVRSQGTRG